MTTTAAVIKILLVDDSALVRQGLRAVIKTGRPDEMEVVGEAGSIQTALEQTKLTNNLFSKGIFIFGSAIDIYNIFL